MKKIFKFNLNSKKKRFISNLIGSIIFLYGILTPMGIGQFSVYITSYFHHYNSNINIQLGNLMMPLLILFLLLSSPLGGFFEHKFGMKLTLALNSILLELIIFIFIIQRNIWITFLLIILIGIICGTVITIPGKNICLYYPEKKGILMALMNSAIIIFGSIMNLIGEKIINPEKITIKKGETYYPFDVAKNYIKLYKLILIIIPICVFISLLLIKKYDPKYNEQTEKLENNNISSEKDENYSKNLKAAIFNSRIWKIAAISIFSEFVMDFVISTFRVYGALIAIDGTLMQYLPVFFGLSNVIFGPIWGYINDKFQNFKIVKTLCLCFIVHSLFIIIFIKSNLIYIICIFVGFIFNSGMHSLIQPHIMKIYGMKYYIEVGGVISISIGILKILKAGLSYIISFYYHTGEELQKPYRIIYIFGMGLNFLAYYLSSKENEELFIYPDSLNKNMQISINENISQIKSEVKIEESLNKV